MVNVENRNIGDRLTPEWTFTRFRVADGSVTDRRSAAGTRRHRDLCDHSFEPGDANHCEHSVGPGLCRGVQALPGTIGGRGRLLDLPGRRYRHS